MSLRSGAARVSRFALLSVALLSASPRTSHAQTWIATLLGSTEVPANSSTAMGFITVTLVSHTLTISESFSGLVSNATGAHIHCCAAPTTTAGIAIPFPAFPTATSGTYNPASFNMLNQSTYTSSFLTASGGTAAGAEAALVAGLNSGLAYANIHDAQFPGGEIRGTLTTAPEPSSVFMLALGMAGVGVVATRRRRSNA
jgi:hypothetical protein